MLDELLEERGKTHGEFSRVATTAQRLKQVMQGTKNWLCLPKVQKEALDMVASKVSRILNGNPDHQDSWTDIRGYIKLVENEMRKGKENGSE